LSSASRNFLTRQDFFSLFHFPSLFIFLIYLSPAFSPCQKSISSEDLLSLSLLAAFFSRDSLKKEAKKSQRSSRQAVNQFLILCNLPVPMHERVDQLLDGGQLFERQ